MIQRPATILLLACVIALTLAQGSGSRNRGSRRNYYRVDDRQQGRIRNQRRLFKQQQGVDRSNGWNFQLKNPSSELVDQHRTLPRSTSRTTGTSSGAGLHSMLVPIHLEGGYGSSFGGRYGSAFGGIGVGSVGVGNVGVGSVGFGNLGVPGVGNIGVGNVGVSKQITQFHDGHAEVIYPDGHTHVHYPSGQVVHTDVTGYGGGYGGSGYGGYGVSGYGGYGGYRRGYGGGVSKQITQYTDGHAYVRYPDGHEHIIGHDHHLHF